MKTKTFPKSFRILTASGYRAVFQQCVRLKGPKVQLVVNSNDLSHPRLGLIIAKRNIRHAVERNRLKRLIRESFRHFSDSLPAVDVVVLVYKGLDKLGNSEISHIIYKQWQRLNQKITS